MRIPLVVFCVQRRLTYDAAKTLAARLGALRREPLPGSRYGRLEVDLAALAAAEARHEQSARS